MNKLLFYKFFWIFAKKKKKNTLLYCKLQPTILFTLDKPLYWPQIYTIVRLVWCIRYNLLCYIQCPTLSMYYEYIHF